MYEYMYIIGFQNQFYFNFPQLETWMQLLCDEKLIIFLNIFICNAI